VITTYLLDLVLLLSGAHLADGGGDALFCQLRVASQGQDQVV
jgi:hypothetical protein